MGKKKNYLATKPPKKVFRFSKVNRLAKARLLRVLPDFEFIDSLETHNCQKIDSSRGYAYYKFKSKQKKKLSELCISRLVRIFFKELRFQMLNNERGVFLKNLGYFAVIKSPKNIMRHYTQISTKDIKDTGEKYLPIFLPIRKDGQLNGFIMDGAFTSNIKRAILYRLKKGKEYKFAFTLLHNLYGRQDTKINPPIEL